MEIQQIEKNIKRSLRGAVLIIVSILLFYFLWFFSNDYRIGSDTAAWGAFGDYVGGILNPLVALLAFYWLTQSVLIQKTELAETKKALKDSSDAQQEQVITQEKKRFEDTFFSLLEQHNKVLEQISNKINSNYTGNRSIIDYVTTDIIEHRGEQAADIQKHLL